MEHCLRSGCGPCLGSDSRRPRTVVTITSRGANLSINTCVRAGDARNPRPVGQIWAAGADGVGPTIGPGHPTALLGFAEPRAGRLVVCRADMQTQRGGAMTALRPDERILYGVAASPGVARARVRVVASHDSPDGFPDGAVLVSHSTDPTMVRMMLRASALVTAIGGPMCHTAIVALELGIPCVVAVPDVLSQVADGDTVEVDGAQGTVAILAG